MDLINKIYRIYYELFLSKIKLFRYIRFNYRKVVINTKILITISLLSYKENNIIITYSTKVTES